MILDSKEIDLEYVQQLQEEIKSLKEENERLKTSCDGMMVGINDLAADFKLTKDSIMKIIGMIGLLDKEGELKENIDFRQMLGTLTKIMWMSDEKRAEEFGFLAAMVPIIIKYKDI